MKDTVANLWRVGLIKGQRIVAPVLGEVKRSYIVAEHSYIHIKKTSKRRSDSVGAHIIRRETEDADWTFLCAESCANYRHWENRPVNIKIKGRKATGHLGAFGKSSILVEMHFVDDNTTERAYMIADKFNTVLEFETS